jgi:putative transposase
MACQLLRFFASVKELVAKVNHFVAHCNQSGKPSRWTATADTILAWGGLTW